MTPIAICNKYGDFKDWVFDKKRKIGLGLGLGLLCYLRDKHLDTSLEEQDSSSEPIHSENRDEGTQELDDSRNHSR